MPLFSSEDNEALHREGMAYPDGPKTRIPDELVNIDFEVLEDAVRSLRLPDDVEAVDDLQRITADEKMALNDIRSEGNRKIIYASLCYSELVKEFIKKKALDDNDEKFPYRLKTFFKGIYAEFYHNGIRGDDLLDRLVSEIVGMIPKPATHPAAYAIIVHLFEFCDLFEKPRQ